MEALPTLSADLIAELDKAYPLVNPGEAESLIEIQRRAGKRELIELLLYLLKREKEEDIHNPRGS